MTKPRLLRITTVPMSLHILLNGQLTFMEQQGFEILTVSADGKERQDILDLGIHHQVVPMTRKITPIQDLIALFKLVLVIAQFKPSIVHTHTPKAGLLGMLAAWICRVPVRMHTVAGLPLMETAGFKRSLLKFTERLTYACAHTVYPNSTGLLNFIQTELKTPARKLKIIGRGSSNGINTDFFSKNQNIEVQASQIRERFSISNSEIVFSFVGRLVKDKGMIELVEAFQKIRNQFPSRLLLIGHFEKDLDPLPPETMKAMEDDSTIIMAGFQQDVRPWLMASNIFVFPSYREGFPNVVVQAACMEIPVIASDINGCNEIIRSGDTGLLVTPKNTSALYDAMISMAKDAQLAERMGKQARDFVVQNFDQQYVWNELLNEYQSKLTVKVY